MAMGTVSFNSCISKLQLRFPSSAATNRDQLLFATPSTQCPAFLCRRLPTDSSVRLRRSVANDSISVSAAEVAAESDALLDLKKKAVDIYPDLKGTSIFLVGMSNSIKSSLGMLLADLLRYYYFDSDGLIVEAAGGDSAAKSFRESDEEAFRQSETEVLKQLSSMGRLVVCAGNGAVQNATNLAFLRHGISLWIDVPLEIVASGIAEKQNQFDLPELSTSTSYSKALSQVQALYNDMRSGYETADATISLQKVASQLGYDAFDAVTTEDMTMAVLKEIEKLTRVKKMMEEAARPF